MTVRPAIPFHRVVLRAVLAGTAVFTFYMVLTIGGASGQTVPAHPLDGYPGFGRSDAASARDNAIALWEAYLREVTTQSCMQRQSLYYAIEVHFPSEPMKNAAEWLDIGRGSSPPNAVTNSAHRATLDARDLDSHSQALYGETAADMERGSRSATPGEAAPEHAFASGACVGEASDAVGSLWDLRRDLVDAVRAFEATVRDSAALLEARAQFSLCASSVSPLPGGYPEQLRASYDEAFANFHVVGHDPFESGYQAAIQKCAGDWLRSYQDALTEAYPEFIESHGQLAAHKERYEDFEVRASQDAAFRDYVASRLFEVSG